MTNPLWVEQEKVLIPRVFQVYQALQELLGFQVTQENQENEETQGKWALLALGVHGETWDPWVQSLISSISREAAGGLWGRPGLQEEMD